jgi:hypothetical protein
LGQNSAINETSVAYLYLVVLDAGSLFIWQTIPETKDKTLEEIGEMWLR